MGACATFWRTSSSSSRSVRGATPSNVPAASPASVSIVQLTRFGTSGSCGSASEPSRAARSLAARRSLRATPAVVRRRRGTAGPPLRGVFFESLPDLATGLRSCCFSDARCAASPRG